MATLFYFDYLLSRGDYVWVICVSKPWPLMLTHYCCFLLVLVPSTPVISPSLVTGITSTTIGWTQPAGAAVDSYSIAYSYDLVECPGEVQGTGRVSNIPGNATTYVLTGLRPYADYTIMLSAENGNGLSGAVNVVVRTADTSKSVYAIRCVQIRAGTVYIYLYYATSLNVCDWPKSVD